MHQGAVLLLNGPSGCGKSTWLALVAALVPPTSGQLTVAGQPLNALKNVAADAWRARTIGFLPQKLHLSAALTVYQNLAMVQWAVGQAQRVALARAVLLQPQVILADEPTASLDDAAAAHAIGLLLATARVHGATLVIATHDARLATLISPEINGEMGFQPLQLLNNQL